MWVRIALWSFLSFGLLFTFVGALVMFATLRHTTNDYHEVLVRLSGDLTQEYEGCGGDAAKMAKFFAEDSETHGHENVFLLVTDSDGAVKVSSTHNKTILEEMVENAASKSTTYRIAGVSADGIRPIAVRVRKSRLGDGCVLSVGYNVTKDELHAVRMGALVGSSLVFVWLVGAGLGAFLGRRFTAPLRKVAAAAGRIADGDYSVRVPVTSEGQEIVDLENAFNSMAAENEKTLSDLRALTDDIAHDLRTPLTRIRAAAETAALAEGEHPLAEDVCEEASSMLEMINTMLDISQTDSRIRRTPREQIEMVAFTGHVIELYSVLAEESSVSLSATMPDAPLYVSAHKGRLQQMLGNLLDNALKFTPKRGRIEVRLASDPFSLSVANTGPGIPASDVPHVFKRFWRGDGSRSLPGNGLGLALVKAIVTSYGGSVKCESTPGEWTVFTVTGLS
jgi:signal transduction histidine kinase